jgi:hypothetical protein
MQFPCLVTQELELRLRNVEMKVNIPDKIVLVAFRGIKQKSEKQNIPRWRIVSMVYCDYNIPITAGCGSQHVKSSLRPARVNTITQF